MKRKFFCKWFLFCCCNFCLQTANHHQCSASKSATIQWDVSISFVSLTFSLHFYCTIIYSKNCIWVNVAWNIWTTSDGILFETVNCKRGFFILLLLFDIFLIHRQEEVEFLNLLNTFSSWKKNADACISLAFLSHWRRRYTLQTLFHWLWRFSKVNVFGIHVTNGFHIFSVCVCVHVQVYVSLSIR